jgi:hypothetical protein
VEPAAEGIDDPLLLADAEVEIPDGFRYLDDDATSGGGVFTGIGDLVQLSALMMAFSPRSISRAMLISPSRVRRGMPPIFTDRPKRS